MVLLSQILPFKFSRWANIGAGILTTLIFISTNLDPDLDNMFFLAIKIATMSGVYWVAWRWKDCARSTASLNFPKTAAM